MTRLISALLLLLPALVGCEIGLSPALTGRSRSTEPSGQGCRLNVETHVATCPCAQPSDLAEMPDRPDLETLEAELDASSDASMLARLTHVRSLRVYELSPLQLGRIAALPQIEHLAFSTRSPVDVHALANMHQLHSLEVVAYTSQPVSVADLEPLASLPALSELALTGPFPPASELEPIFPRTVVTVHAGTGLPPPPTCKRP